MINIFTENRIYIVILHTLIPDNRKGIYVGGLIFFSERLGDNEHKIMFVVIILSVFTSFIVSRFWTDTEFLKDKAVND